MFGYITRLDHVNYNEDDSERYASAIEATGHDLLSLVFGYLQEWLYLFHESQFIAKQVTIEHLDTQSMKIKSKGKGEIADWSRRAQGTEVKAITYSNLYKFIRTTMARITYTSLSIYSNGL